MKSNESILNLREAAAYIGVHFRTLLRWVGKKKIPYIKYPNGRVKFQRDDLARWLESKTVVPDDVEHPTDRRRRKREETEYEKTIRIANEMLATHYSGKKRNRSN